MCEFDVKPSHASTPPSPAGRGARPGRLPPVRAQPVRERAGAYDCCVFMVTCAPVASVTRPAPNSWPAVHAPGLAPARTRRVVSAAMAAVARTPSPARSSAVTVCPSGPTASAQVHEPVPLTGAAGLAMYATTLAAPL